MTVASPILPSRTAMKRRLILVASGTNFVGALLTFFYFSTIDPPPTGQMALRTVPLHIFAL